MRRFAVAVAGTTLGTALLIGLKSPGSGAAQRSPSAIITPAPTPVPRPTASRPARSTPPRVPSKTPTKGPGAPAVKTIDGPVVQTRYGAVQVEIVVAGTKLTDVKALRLPDEDRRSRNISDRAAPVLRQEALQVQSADIDTVSGATYTSEGYRESLQAALDAL